MPSVVVTMTLATMTAITEKPGAKIKPSFIMVDNDGAAATAVIQFQDVFTPSASVAVPVPIAQTIDRVRCSVPILSCVSFEDELKDIVFIGGMQIVRGALDANCFITVGYDFV